MKKVILKIYICGMSKRNFSKNIMVYKPNKVFKSKILLDDYNISNDYKISKLLRDFKNKRAVKACEKKFYNLNDFNWKNIYIKQRGTLLSLQSDKNVLEIFNFFKTNKLEIAYIFIAGGASIHYSGYTFVVHSNEKIHKNNPHVHVEKDDASVRYSLRTFERFPNDDYTREYKRDEKKIIIPALKKHKDKLWYFWQCSMGGFDSPKIDCEGKEYYKES